MTKVLIAEDDAMIAGDLEDILTEAGYEVCGVAGTVALAIDMGRRHQPDLALLDLRLRNGEMGTEVAAALCPQLRLGVLYATGNPDHPALAGADGVGCLGKPFSAGSLLLSLRLVHDIAAGRRSEVAAPRGFVWLRQDGLPPARPVPARLSRAA